MYWLHRQQGLSMLEVMVAVAILGVVGVALMTGLNGAFRAQDISREQVRAENLARAQLEYVREQTYFAAPSNPYIIPPGDDPGAYSVPPPGVVVPQGYEIIVTITQYCDGLGPDGEPGGDSDCYVTADIQMNTVRVSREGKGLVVVEDLKTRR